MKTVKYLLVGAFFCAATCTVSAQATDYNTQLENITQLIKDGNADALKAPLKQYNKQFKKNAEALVALGNAYLTAKDFIKANEYADKAIGVNAKYGNAYILKGDIQAIQDEGGEAANWYMQAMTLDPQNAQGYIRYANVYRKVDPSETERTLQKLRQVLPDYPIEAEAGHSYYTMGNYEKAMEHFLKEDPERLPNDLLAEYCITAINTNKHAEGLHAAEVGLRKNPDNMSFVRLALINAINSKQHDKALSFANMLMQNPVEKTSSDYTYYGRALAANEQHQEAISQFEKSLAMDADNHQPLRFISESYTALGNEDKGVEYMQQYLSKETSARPSDYNRLADIYLQKVKKGEDKEANLQKAFGVYDTMAQKFPTLSTYCVLLQGNAAFQNEFDTEALAKYAQIISILEPKGSSVTEDEQSYLRQAYRNTALIHWTKDDLESAKPYFEKVIQIDPNDKYARQALGLDKQEETKETK